jgi:hypothetical protein
MQAVAADSLMRTYQWARSSIPTDGWPVASELPGYLHKLGWTARQALTQLLVTGSVKDAWEGMGEFGQAAFTAMFVSFVGTLMVLAVVARVLVFGRRPSAARTTDGKEVCAL